MKLKSLLLISISVLMLVGCQTSDHIVEVNRMVLPSLEAFEPPRVPVYLVEKPLTDVDLLHNSIQFEFLLYEWQDYADGLKSYIKAVKDIQGEN